MIARLFRTAFLVCIFSALGFAYIDYLEPGFVSFVFSVYWWLAAAIVFGILWATVERKDDEKLSSFLLSLSSLLIGLALAGIVWHNGEVFGDFRLLFAVCTFIMPSFLYHVL